jgi:uncharacterized protein YlzI (FlbEa/FlbD family)
MIITKYRSIEITQDNIVNRVPNNLLLSDNVLVFNYEGQWIIIPLSILIKYPIIYLLNTKTKEFGSIVLCLLTLRSMYVYEKVRWIGYSGKNGDIGIEATFNNMNGETMGFENKLDKNGERIVDFKRSQTKIQSLRSALIEYGDVMYLNLDVSHKSDLITPEYYRNLINYNDEKIENLNIFPKTLCTLIQYVSDNKIKTTIVVPSISNTTNFELSYDSKKSKVDDYLANSSEKLIEKKAFIMNILYYTAQILFPDIKYIIL